MEHIFPAPSISSLLRSLARRYHNIVDWFLILQAAMSPPLIPSETIGGARSSHRETWNCVTDSIPASYWVSACDRVEADERNGREVWTSAG